MKSLPRDKNGLNISNVDNDGKFEDAKLSKWVEDALEND